MKIKKRSRQRDAIMEYLKGTDSHPTADEIYDKVRISFPSISLATVYRNLNQLYEDGEIRKISCGFGSDHFDYRTEDHGHFVCTRCRRVYDVFVNVEEFMNAEAEFPGEVEGCSVMYYGICSNCK